MSYLACACERQQRVPLGFLGLSTTAPAKVSTVPVAVKPSLASTSSAPGGTQTVNATTLAQSICKQYGHCPGGSNPFMTDLENAISTRFLFPYTPQKSCGANPSGTGSTIATIGSAGTKIGAGVLAAAAVTGPAAPIVAGIGAIVSLIGGLIGHHAQAVATQDDLLCANVPQANAVLQAIDAGLANGSVTPAQATQAYQQLQSQFSAAMKTDPSYKTGDALWLYNVIVLPAVIQARNADLQAGVLTGGAPGPWTQTAASPLASVDSALASLESVFTSGGMAPWLVAGALAVLFLI
jgi:hypothetical protein